MIGAGKTSIAEIIAEALDSQVYYENVDDSEILPLFYTATPEEQKAKRYPFLLQLEFLNRRYADIKRANHHPHNVLDRSIYEDWYFCKVNNDLGNISDLEFQIYEDLLKTLLNELKEQTESKSDLMIYLSGSFEKIIERIHLRGRDFEKDKALYDYYYQLWQGYDEWTLQFYDSSQILQIDIDKYDIVANSQDRQTVINLVINKLDEMEHQ